MPLKMDGSVIEGRNSDRDNCNIVIVSLNKEKFVDVLILEIKFKEKGVIEFVGIYLFPNRIKIFKSCLAHT
jgi:hypothetical protein